MFESDGGHRPDEGTTAPGSRCTGPLPSGAEAPRSRRAHSSSPFGIDRGRPLLGCSPAAVGLVAAVDRLAESGVATAAPEIAQLRHQLDRLEALVARAQVLFDQFELWREQGASSLRGWLVLECDTSRRAATRESKRTDRLASWPEVSEAWRVGLLTGAKVDAMVAIVPSRFVRLFAEHAAGVIEAIAPLDVHATEVALRQWVRMAEADDGPDQFDDRSSGIHVGSLLDGSFAISGQLYGADAAIVEAALRVFDVPDPVDDNGQPIAERRTFSQRTADALVAMARAALDHREGPGDNGRFQPHVSLVIDVAEARAAALRGAGVSTLAELDRVATERNWTAVERAWFTEALAHHGDGVTADGSLLDASAISALCCDSVVQRVLTAGSKVIDLGREVRTATPAQRRAVIARDRHCRAPGCRTKPRFCEVHHVDHWMLGGRTDVGRMVLLCGTHHREFHRPGHRMELSDDATFTVHSDVGWTRSSVPERDEKLVFPRRMS